MSSVTSLNEVRLMAQKTIARIEALRIQAVEMGDAHGANIGEEPMAFARAALSLCSEIDRIQAVLADLNAAREAFGAALDAALETLVPEFVPPEPCAHELPCDCGPDAKSQFSEVGQGVSIKVSVAAPVVQLGSLNDNSTSGTTLSIQPLVVAASEAEETAAREVAADQPANADAVTGKKTRSEKQHDLSEWVPERRLLEGLPWNPDWVASKVSPFNTAHAGIKSSRPGRIFTQWLEKQPDRVSKEQTSLLRSPSQLPC